MEQWWGKAAKASIEEAFVVWLNVWEMAIFKMRKRCKQDQWWIQNKEQKSKERKKRSSPNIKERGEWERVMQQKSHANE